MANKFRYLYFVQVNMGLGYGWEDYGATETKTGAEERVRWLRKQVNVESVRPWTKRYPKHKYRVIKRRVPFNELVWWI